MMWYVQYLQARDVVSARDAEAARVRLSRVALLRDGAADAGTGLGFRRAAASGLARIGAVAERAALALDPDALCGDHRAAVLSNRRDSAAGGA